MKKPKIFISYSHEDAHWKDYIIKHFKSAKEKFELWHDGNIELGEKWYEKIKDSIYTADVAILLISVNFLTSEFIEKDEIPDLIQRCEKDNIHIFPVFIGNVAKIAKPEWLNNKKISRQGFPSPEKPLKDLVQTDDIEGLKKSPKLDKEIPKLIDKIYRLYDNTIFEDLKNELNEQYSFIYNYIEQYSTKSELLNSCKKYLDKNLYLRIKNYQTINEIIIHIADNEKFPCIVKNVYTNNVKSIEIENWLGSKKVNCHNIQTEQTQSQNQLLVIIFKHIDKNKYEVTFRAKNLLEQIDENDSKIYDLEEDRDILVSTIIKYVNDNPEVHLVLPIELFDKDINTWEVDFNSSLSTLSKVTIKPYDRYNANEKFLNFYKQRWKIIEKRVKENKPIFIVNQEEHLRKCGNNMQECGLVSNIKLEKKHFEYLLKTELSHIMMWLTRDKKIDLKELCEDSKNIKVNYHKFSKNEPINLMWDNPYEYYYPDENS